MLPQHCMISCFRCAALYFLWGQASLVDSKCCAAMTCLKLQRAIPHVSSVTPSSGERLTRATASQFHDDELQIHVSLRQMMPSIGPFKRDPLRGLADCVPVQPLMHTVNLPERYYTRTYYTPYCTTLYHTIPYHSSIPPHSIPYNTVKP